MLKKVLIANRGEIAMRILRGCSDLGIESVAVYSNADRLSTYVRKAAEAHHIGPPPVSESYLRGDKLIDIALNCGADGIHPGYGLLAENADFAQAAIDAGLTWIGPPPEAIAMMGDKTIARDAMTQAGVPVVPGSPKGLSDEELQAIAPEIGYPLLVKAAAGGGGKGMRAVHAPEELAAALRMARNEAKAAFGDNQVYLERLLIGARHVEVQILADAHGNVIHLGERECSIQRRHQKLIEESPSPAVNSVLRERMGAVAIAAARAANYVSAGTVEFLLDQNGSFYFLEMNTRLQVEHPVTEMVTGVDIVKEMLRIAAGRRMSHKQKDIQLKGWAIECRILAEDAFNNFIPSIGQITGLSLPTGGGVRVDSGVYYNMEVSPYYDSLLAKLVTHGGTRAESILRMRRALDEFTLTGVKTTIPFHIKMMNHARFQAGQLDTNFLDNHFSMDDDPSLKYAKVAAAAAALVAHRHSKEAILLHQGGPSPWRLYGRREALDRRLK
ncbi:MAG TPA: acetyl-CoA carboxylase biotin carboxylase subunit [Chloroflexi bacterium]|nr:acetyl-CoA carboxylase biotin carboxylase subunit [Chloroflexota bacterium]